MSATGWCWDGESVESLIGNWGHDRSVAEIEAAEHFIYGIAQEQWPNRPGRQWPDHADKQFREHEAEGHYAVFIAEQHTPVGRLYLIAYAAPGDAAPTIRSS